MDWLRIQKNIAIFSNRWRSILVIHSFRIRFYLHGANNTDHEIFHFALAFARNPTLAMVTKHEEYMCVFINN